MFVRNFHTAGCWQPFQQCRAPVHYKRIALSCFACFQPGHRHDTFMFMARSSSVHGASLANVMFCHTHKWCKLIGAAHFPAAAYNGFDRECYQALSCSWKLGMGLETRLVMPWWMVCYVRYGGWYIMLDLWQLCVCVAIFPHFYVTAEKCNISITQ